MNIAIVDDQATERSHIADLLKEYAQLRGIDLVCAEYESGEALLRDYTAYRFTAVLLDIYMDGMTGIETARRIRETDKDVVLFFLTTSESHYSDAFTVFASGYFIKPCARDEIFRTFDHFLRRSDRQERGFSFSYSRSNYLIRFSELVSLETRGNYISLTNKNGDVFHTRMTFTAAREKLDERFLTLMKGVVVNMDYISRFEEHGCCLSNGAVLPVNRKKEKVLQEMWFNYKISKSRNEAGLTGGNGT